MAHSSILDGICPMCDSEQVYVSKPERTNQDIGAHGISRISIDWRTQVSQRHYICLTCFYVEIYAPMTEKQVERVRKNWIRVGSASSKQKRKNDEP